MSVCVICQRCTTNGVDVSVGRIDELGGGTLAVGRRGVSTQGVLISTFALEPVVP